MTPFKVGDYVQHKCNEFVRMVVCRINPGSDIPIGCRWSKGTDRDFGFAWFAEEELDLWREE